MIALAFAVETLMGACSPPDPSKIDVSPNCPGGTRAAATVTINADLSKIRPFGNDIKIRVRGNRVSTDVCFHPGAKASLLDTLEGTGSKTVTESNVADAGWDFQITALSGGDQMPVSLPKTLGPGMNHVLAITGNAAGDLQASFP